MGLISTAIQPQGEQRSTNYEAILGGGVGPSGVRVTTDNALQMMAVYACVKILAESVASLPLITYQTSADGSKQKATGEPIYRLLHDAPNPYHTSYEYREIGMAHLAMWGNAYSDIERNNRGQILNLWPLRPDKVEILNDERHVLGYKYTLPNGQWRTLSPSNTWHIKGFGTDGFLGLSPIGMARKAIGLGIATEEFGSRFFGNGARPGGMLKHPGLLSPTAKQNLRDSMQSQHMGIDNAHRMMILEEGLDYTETGIPPEDAQFLETRRFQVTEIARMYRVPPHFLADLEHATFSNIEHQGIEFVVHTLMPWLVRHEQRIKKDLLIGSDLFSEFLVDGLLRGDTESRYQAYATAIQNGWMSPNDARRLENMNPRAGGDEYFMPLNMQGSGSPPNQTSNTRVSPPLYAPTQLAAVVHESGLEDRRLMTVRARQGLIRTYKRLLIDSYARVVRREVSDIKRQAKKDLSKRGVDDLKQWLNSFYRNHQAFFIKQILPVMLAYGEQTAADVAIELDSDPEDIETFIEDYVTDLAAQHSSIAEGELVRTLESAQADETDPLEALTEKLDHWDDVRPTKIGIIQATAALNIFTKTIYRTAGILKLRWNAHGENCPYCQNLNGVIVGIDDSFVSAGQALEPDGADRPLAPNSDVFHGPLHGGCDCTITAHKE